MLIGTDPVVIYLIILGETEMQDVLEIDDTEKLVLETMENYESLSSTPHAHGFTHAHGFIETSSDYESMPTGDPSIEDFGNLAELWEAQVSGGGESQVEDIKVREIRVDRAQG